ncbi:MAG: S8 family serine peptidase [Flavobacteriaceae bacterium]|nr:S8 family serine peptidase [Flavobacteriaceae bacterium]
MLKKILLLSFIFSQCIVFSQEDAWVYFTDKENVANAIANPITILTQKAIDRKTNHNVVIDERDVPVNESYIAQVKNATGIVVLAKSKWFNAVHVRGTETNINDLLNLNFVVSIDFADDSLNMSSNEIEQAKDKFSIENAMIDFDYGNTQNQVKMIAADALHELDYTGEGVTVAVLDAGFPNVNTMGAFQRLRDAGDLLDGYDFVNRTSDVYAYTGNTHGTKVLSTMAGFIQDQYVGTAPDASYYLFRTEEAEHENPVEESYWVEAAERADSLGVDIINTSLGYKGYDNPNYSYTNNDLDGNTAFITRGANIAFEKGMLLVNSAGNSGASGVNAPADAEGVFSIGAVDLNGDYVSFSSQGSAIQPTQKPDVVARGAAAFVIGPDNVIVQNNGTSFSSPIMAGGLACLRQALPDLTNAEMMQLVRESASQYTTPDYFLGYGIPDLGNALAAELSNQNNERTHFKLFPNPVENYLQVLFPNEVDVANLLIHDILGKLVIDTTIQPFQPIDLQQLSSGLYLLKIQAEGVNSKSLKLLKQ